MPLTFQDGRTSYDHDRDFVRFTGADGTKAVHCAVSREALTDREHTRDESDYVAAFFRNVSAVQETASEIYDRGIFEEDGLVLVKTGDLNP